VKVHNNGKGGVEGFTFHGAGWGHGVGLCQIGAAIMASKGFSAEEILLHYFPGTEVKKIY
jgi:SpoIID/LytB domain protein